ncbi:MAG TPA: DUF5916 domain-containing protein [Saprospiraceae bacterium]|nr:DUF5916 domain-containing protein [Saprospiraceae bacterium]
MKWNLKILWLISVMPFLSYGQSSRFPQRSFQVNLTEDDIKIDGFLNEDIWLQAEPIGHFYQNFPEDSILAEHNTEIKMVYTNDALYIGVVCKTAGNYYVTPSLKRDFRAGGNDNITLIFDAFNDGANAFFFGVNPFGVMREGLISNGGQVLSDFSVSWDNIWSCRTSIGDQEWVAEIRIPFSTFRFNNGSTKWRFNSYRFDMQTYERSTYVRIPRNQWIFSLAYMADLHWQEPLEGSGTPVTVIPYLAGATSRDYFAGTPSNTSFSFGADFKIAVTPGLNLDLTVNPDFSQVEVDQQITDLSRFEIFFPERRQFFLENADLFSSFGFDRINPFFSRRIGVAIDTLTGVPVQNTIYGGARLSGKLNENWRLGLMTMQTAKEDAFNLPAFNYSVASLQRRLGARSFGGVIMVNKQNFQKNDGVDNYNRVFGLDYNLATNDNRWSGKTFLHKSFSAGESGNDWSHGLRLVRNQKSYQVDWNHEYVGENYNAEVGFIQRTGYGRINPEFKLFFYSPTGYLNWHGPIVGLEQIWQSGFGMTDQRIYAGYGISGSDNSNIELSMNREYIFLFSDFDPTGTESEPLRTGTDYTYYYFTGSYNSDQSKSFYFNTSLFTGEYFAGLRFGVFGDLNYRWQPFAIFGLRFAVNYFNMDHLPGWNSTILLGPNLELTLSRKLFINTFLQYNSQSENTNINVRLQWRFAPVSDFFLVWTENYFTHSGNPSDRFAFDITNRSIVAKVTYWLNI